MEPIILGKDKITAEHLVAVAREGAPVTIGPEALERLARGRAVIDRYLAEDKPVYGLTRGLGGRAVVSVADGERDEMSTVMLRARACGAGPRFERVAVRAFLFARLASMTQGRAGVRPKIAEQLAAFLNKGLHPEVPEIGSVGASDLALLACMGLPVMGEGRAEVGGRLMSGAEALAAVGLQPLALAPKEGLGLCSANSVSAGLGALVLQEMHELLALAEATCSLSFEAFRANLSPLDPRVVAARPAPGQPEAAKALRDLLVGSGLTEPGAARRIQDPISLRCASHTFGALRAALSFARPAVEVELNGAGDNPVVLYEDGEILSTGNFHTPALAQAFDLLAISLTQVASMTSQRIGRLLGRKFTDLPEMLSEHADAGTVRIGMGLLGHCARTLVKDMRMYATPASLDDASGYDVEDHEPMTPRAVRKLRDMLPLWRQVIACEMLVAAQAYDLRQPTDVAPTAQRLYHQVRGLVPKLEDDRSQLADLEKLSSALAERLVSL